MSDIIYSADLSFAASKRWVHFLYSSRPQIHYTELLIMLPIGALTGYRKRHRGRGVYFSCLYVRSKFGVVNLPKKGTFESSLGVGYHFQRSGTKRSGRDKVLLIFMPLYIIRYVRRNVVKTPVARISVQHVPCVCVCVWTIAATMRQWWLIIIH